MILEALALFSLPALLGGVLAVVHNILEVFYG